MNNVDYTDYKKQKMITIGILCFSIIILSTIVFAYFSSTLSNQNNESLSTNTASISLVFDDNDNGVNEVLNLGESVVKKFTLENTGTKDAYARINFVDLVNTYNINSLTYVLEQSESENGSYTRIGGGRVPSSSSPKTTPLRNGILVPVGVKYYYKLTITLNNLSSNQNSDINAEFHTRFNIEDGLLTGVDKILNLVASADPTSTSVIGGGSGNNCTQSLAYDGTSDNNLRYVGTTPCNYVRFNDEFWRIVGVMNNVENSSGKKETRLKIVRSYPLDGKYSWDGSRPTVNDWTKADLMTELNGDYLNYKTGTTYWYSNTDTKGWIYNYEWGLKPESQELIEDAKWYLGTRNADSGQASAFYTSERGNRRAGNYDCSSNCPTALSWIGKVAPLYASDYGFAVGGSVRNTCLSKTLINYSSNNCNNNDWVSTDRAEWLINPHYRLIGALHIDYFGQNAFDTYIYIGDYSEDYYIYARPSVYLKSNVRIIKGNGSTSSPYILS